MLQTPASSDRARPHFGVGGAACLPPGPEATAVSASIVFTPLLGKMLRENVE